MHRDTGRQLTLSLRTYLAIYGVVLLLPAAIFGGVGLTIYEINERDRIADRAVDVAETANSQIDAELRNLTVVLDTLASSPLIDAADFREFHRRARLVMAGTHRAILLVDDTMAQLVNTRVAYGTELPPTSDPETAMAVFRTARPQISNVFIGAVSGQPVFNVEVPVIREGEVKYALIGTDRAADLLGARLGDENSRGWILAVVDRNGVLISRSADAETFVGRSLPSAASVPDKRRPRIERTSDMDGTPVLRTSVKSRLSGWMTVATIPVDLIEAPLRRTWMIFLAFVVGLVLLAILAASFVARRMAGPIDAVRQRADALGRGETVAELYSPLREANIVAAALSAASDELQRRSERTRFLVGELAHRSKNLIGVVTALVRQSLPREMRDEDWPNSLLQRLNALGVSIDLLVSTEWQGVDLGDLARRQLAPFIQDEDRVRIGGTKVRLSADAAQSLALAFHELATNATKYGALSGPAGIVSIAWVALPADPRSLRITWEERGGPPVTPPQRRGFGSMLLDRAIRHALGASVSIDFAPEGLTWTATVPGQPGVADF